VNILLIELSSALAPAQAKALSKASSRFLQDVGGEDLVFSSARVSEGDLTVFYVATGGSEVPFSQVYANYPEPYYFLVRGEANSLASALEILSFLQKKGLRGQIISGDIAKIHDDLLSLAAASQAKEYLASSRLGIIGEPSDWLIASSVDFALAKAIFGTQFLSIPFSVLEEEIAHEPLLDKELPQGLKGPLPPKAALQEAFRIYGALLRITRKYSLNGFSLRCFDLIGKYRATACLALGLLNSEGVSAGCEGDEASLLSMQILRALGEPSFQGNPVAIDPEKKTLVLAHCTLPLAMADSYSLSTHYESGLGIGLRGRFPKEEVTIFKLSPALDSYHLLRGRVAANLTAEDCCRSQAAVDLLDSPEPLLTHPYGNHLLLAYGDLKKPLVALLDSLGIKGQD
jgi:L-fucose isomerase-like protein